MALDEPATVYPEAEFAAALIRVVAEALKATAGAAVVPSFGLDMGIFLRFGAGTRAVFLEAKSYGAQRQGGVGFGNGRGEGPQVDLLLCSADQRAILDAHVRWAVADATRPLGSARYALLTCSEARNAVMGVVARGKQNNFRMSAINPHFVVWQSFCAALARFLDVAADSAV